MSWEYDTAVATMDAAEAQRAALPAMAQSAHASSVRALGRAAEAQACAAWPAPSSGVGARQHADRAAEAAQDLVRALREALVDAEAFAAKAKKASDDSLYAAQAAERIQDEAISVGELRRAEAARADSAARNAVFARDGVAAAGHRAEAARARDAATVAGRVVALAAEAISG